MPTIAYAYLFYTLRFSFGLSVFGVIFAVFCRLFIQPTWFASFPMNNPPFFISCLHRIRQKAGEFVRGFFQVQKVKGVVYQHAITFAFSDRLEWKLLSGWNCGHMGSHEDIITNSGGRGNS